MVKMRLSEENALINQRLLGAEAMATAIEDLGYELRKEGGKYKFARRDEKTPSCVVNADATWHDFGDGTHGDWAELYAERQGCSFRDAVKEGLRRFGIVADPGYVPAAPAPVKRGFEKELRKAKPISAGLLKFFSKEASEHAARYTELCRRLMPFAHPAELQKAQRWFSIGYDAKEDRLTFPVYDLDGNIVNIYKYTPYKMFMTWRYRIGRGRARFFVSEPVLPPRVFNPGLFERPVKVKYLKGRERALYNLGVLKFKPKVLYITEGEKDAINAMIAKKAAITQGGANMWKAHFAQDLLRACAKYGVDAQRLKIVVVQDHDAPGLDSTVRIYEDLTAVFPNVVMAFWKRETAEWVRQALPRKITDPEGAKATGGLGFWKRPADPSRPHCWLQPQVCVVDAAIEGEVVLKFDLTDYETLRRKGRL